MNKIYLAPMEGVTDHIFRNTFNKYFGGVDKYYTPFLAPTQDHVFPPREWKQIAPDHNKDLDVVPQILTNNADNFIWAAGKLESFGYKEINFNVGCPSGTVVAKKKGSGLLFYPQELDAILYYIFDWASGHNVDISVKTRLGKVAPEEFEEILSIYNKYPISELTVHPRITSDMYKLPVRLEWYEYASANSKNKLCYNGDIYTVDDAVAIENRFPDTSEAIMLGRGLISDPFLACKIRGEEPGDDKNQVISDFLDDLLLQYQSILSGDKPVLYRMKEIWAFLERSFPGHDKDIKKIKKANRIADYVAAKESFLK